METSLIKLDAFQQALAEAKTIPEISDLANDLYISDQTIYNQLKLARQYPEFPNAFGNLPLKNSSKLLTSFQKSINHDGRLILKKLGINDYHLSSRWQKLAEIPE